MTKIIFLGTGTSQGVPVIGCKCDVCLSADPKDKRLRSSVAILQNGVTIVIDAGPDFRQQMLSHGIDNIDALLITHDHKDHTAGIDDVRAYNYIHRKAIDIYATEQTQQTIKKDFDYAFREDKYPGAPDIELHTINTDKNFTVKGIGITPVNGLHYTMPVTGFKIGNIAYLTDFSFIDDAELEKIKGVDVLIINALRKEDHLSHFTLNQALAVGQKVKPGRLYLTHVSHQMGKYEHLKDELPENVFFAYDGLTIETD